MKTRSFKELYESRHEPANLRPIAEAYWRVMLLCALAVIAGMIAFGIWEFSAVMETISSGTAVSSAPQQAPLDRTALERAVNQFSQRRADYEYSKGIAPAIPDPAK